MLLISVLKNYAIFYYEKFVIYQELHKVFCLHFKILVRTFQPMYQTLRKNRENFVTFSLLSLCLSNIESNDFCSVSIFCHNSDFRDDRIKLVVLLFKCTSENSKIVIFSFFEFQISYMEL